MAQLLTFQDTQLQIIEHSDQVWLTSSDIGAALGYRDRQRVNSLFTAHKDEFSAETTCVTIIVTHGKVRKARLFNRRGAHLLAMFATTERAKAFRKWVLDVLEEKAGAMSDARAVAKAEVTRPNNGAALPEQERMLELLKGHVAQKLGDMPVWDGTDWQFAGKADALPAPTGVEPFDRAMARLELAEMIRARMERYGDTQLWQQLLQEALSQAGQEHLAARELVQRYVPVE
jgi:hypothetical protein